MARKRKRRQMQLLKRNRKFALVGLVFSLFSFSRLGFVGHLAANLSRLFVGDAYRFFSALLFALSLFVLLKGQLEKVKNPRRLAGFLILFVSILILLHALLFRPLIHSSIQPFSLTWNLIWHDLKSNSINHSLGGGLLGGVFYSLFYFLFDQVGSYIILALLIFSALLMISNVSFAEFFQFVSSTLSTMRSGLHSFYSKQKEKQSAKKEGQAEANQKLTENSPTHEQNTQPVKEEPSQPSQTEKVKIESHLQAQKGQADPLSAQNSAERTSTQARPSTEKTEEASGEESSADFEIVYESENEDYRLPPLTLLNPAQPTDQSSEYEVIEDNIEKLEATFDSFDVDAKVVKANLGPAVTKYEIQPATGVKVSKIVNLQDDLALALAAKDIRIEAPIPGRALIGIEVPNQEVSFISFRETMELTQRDSDHLLEVPLGKDISGRIQLADLAKMPHTLIAGSTGSGKSVAINSIITSLLMRTKPNEVKLMMIDPKMVELNDYNGVPHLLTPVVTNPKKAARALNNVVKEMERRYELFASTGTKNRATYNEYVYEYNQKEGKELPALPYIVVIVDELADLMMVASKEVEDAIMRLAQMARAAGIHMILATQRPSVDVLTGTIKANVPSRIAFAVSSGTDSRTILDSTGAEKLLGKGDMLYLPMGANQPMRVQGTFITDDEVKRVVDFVKDQQEVNYVEEMAPSNQPDSALNDEPEDEYFNEAVDLVTEAESASVSMLQRRFRIGYNRAARMIDEMEERGIVGPANGSKPREVLIDSSQAEADPVEVDE